MAGGRFLALDGLRGLAALLLIVDHMPSVINYVIPSGDIAVDFFFVLSGFVIAHAYGERLDAGMSPLDFMRRRVIRLYPLYILGCVLGSIFALHEVMTGRWNFGGRNFAEMWAMALAFIPLPLVTWWNRGMLFPLDFVAWSLFLELAANLVYALTPALRRPRAILLLLPITAVGLIWATLATDSPAQGWEPRTFLGGFPRVAYGFFIGVLIHAAWLRGYRFSIPLWLALPLMLAMAASLSLAQGEARLVYFLFLQIIAVPLFVAGVAEARIGMSVARLCTALGAISYGVYVLHGPIMHLSYIWFGQPSYDPATYENPMRMLLLAAASVTAAAITYVFYDKPARAWLTRVTGRRQASAAA